MPQPKPDGGPAFPQPEQQAIRGGTQVWIHSHPGMSLRDYFAGQALVGFLANSSLREMTAAEIASRAGQQADAMIAARDA